MVEIVPHRRGLTRLHQRLGRAVAKRRDRLRAIPSHRLIFATGPSRDSAYYLEHLAQTALDLGPFGANRLVEGLAAETDGLRELTLGHPEALGHSLHRDLPAFVYKCRNKGGARVELEVLAGSGEWRNCAACGSLPIWVSPT